MTRLVLSILSRLLVGMLVVSPIYSCSQDEDVQRLRLAFLLFLYQQDVEEATVSEVAALYKEGERLAIALKKHLDPAGLPLYQESVKQTYQAKDQARQALDIKRQALEKAVNIYDQKKQAYEEADEEYRRASRAENKWSGRDYHKNKERLRLTENRKCADRILIDKRKEYRRSEEEYIQARKAEEDTEMAYIRIVLHAWDWLDLYVEQLVQDGEVREDG